MLQHLMANFGGNRQRSGPSLLPNYDQFDERRPEGGVQTNAFAHVKVGGDNGGELPPRAGRGVKEELGANVITASERRACFKVERNGNADV